MAAPKQENNVKNKPDAKKDEMNKLNIAELFENYKDRIKKFEGNECEFGTDKNRIISDLWKDKRDRIAFHMSETYPLVHGGVLSLAYNFLSIKRKHGSSKEKQLYSKMTMVDFFNRLATKRAVVFYQSSDVYLLRNGYYGEGNWHLIGTENEDKSDIYSQSRDSSKKPKLEEYLSYDELMISALCGISSPTYFINNGDRRNCGRIKNETWNEFYPMEGVYMGLVGARFEKPKVMEQALMLIDQQQNTPKNGYGSYETKSNDDQKGGGGGGQNNNNDNNNDDEKKGLDDKALLERVDSSIQKFGDKSKLIMRAFEQFYNINYLPTFDEIKNGFARNDQDITKRYLEKSRWGTSYLDMEIYKQRIRISLEIFLFDADKRAKQYKQIMAHELDTKKLSGAFCHVVGLGTGVWAWDKYEQNRIIVKVTKEIIESTNLENIDCIYFSWMTPDCMMESEQEESKTIFELHGKDSQDNDQYLAKDVNKHEIIIQSGKRAPADELYNPFRQCLLVAMYAWDSNSFPGNEYYFGQLSASGDPAAASCSTIPFVQNSEINKEYINGKNTGMYFYNPNENKYEFYKLKDINFEEDKEGWLKKSVLSIPYKRD